jgi:chemotaxis protein MotB
MNFKGAMIMTLTRRISIFVLCAAVTGCVSSSKYKKLQTEKAGLETEKAGLQTQVATLQQEKTDLAQQKDDLAKSSENTETQYNKMVHDLADEVQKGNLKVTQYQNMLTVDVADQIFFASGSATLKAGGQEVLKKLAKSLNDYPDKIIRVVGHTDNVRLAKAIQSTYPTNWELSVIRATNVVRFLQDNGVAPERLIATGRGEYAPVADNSTPEGRQKNRRIEIMLMDKSLVQNMETKKK